MKKNTKLLLLCCFAPSESPQESKWRNYEFFYDLFSDISEGGIRSLLFELVKKGYLKRFLLSGQSYFEITSAGISKLSLLYPGLKLQSRKKEESNGHLLIFISPPVDDPHFQLLRKRLKQSFFVTFTKAVYFYPLAHLPNEIFELLLNKYSASVALASIKNFSLAFPDHQNSRFLTEKKLQKALSELSTDLSKLIDSFNTDKKMIYQLKNTVSKNFYFLAETLSQQQMLLLESRTVQEAYFQAWSSWSQLVFILYFSRK